MPDREKVIRWLEACSTGCEEGCPYEYDGLVSKVECKADLMRDALELLKGQEPRVLTLEEVQNDCPDYVYLETSTGWLECCVKCEGLSNKYDGCFVYEANECFVGRWEEYGKMWRCWNYRPTDEQRKAVKWE